MIGDPLYELIQRRRDEKRPKRPAAKPRPEGVTIYRCDVAVDREGDDEEPSILCGRITEAKPYVPRPWHHGQPMAIAGYDWDRDVT